MKILNRDVSSRVDSSSQYFDFDDGNRYSRIQNYSSGGGYWFLSNKLGFSLRNLSNPSLETELERCYQEWLSKPDSLTLEERFKLDFIELLKKHNVECTPFDVKVKGKYGSEFRVQP
jgi:hypothetical protein